MDVNKNSYTFVFAAAMVVVVAAVLAFAATSLKPMQDRNVELEKKQNILKSIEVEVSREEAELVYGDYIKEEIVIRSGQAESGIVAFDVDLAKEIKKETSERDAPLYIAEKEGKKFYIIPLRGKGLWGPIWGYLSLEEDVNTVFGATFDHKTETPGLGAEIKEKFFTEQFKGKKILGDAGDFKSIIVKKGNASGSYEVDGISGGTITSVGVEDMLKDCIIAYVPYLKSQASSAQAQQIEEVQQPDTSEVADTVEQAEEEKEEYATIQ